MHVWAVQLLILGIHPPRNSLKCLGIQNVGLCDLASWASGHGGVAAKEKVRGSVGERRWEFVQEGCGSVWKEGE